ncbi:MAG: Mov34/MPN/PAD-1 family protein [Myxococcales bacterium]|nr:Mov34/MPN/PAD-1 family protein [Myxococcales bacterium]
MIAVAAAWPAIVAAVEAEPGEVAGWIAAAAAAVTTVALDLAGAWTDGALVALARAARGPTPPLTLFHSHPEGRAALSAHDVRAWAPTGTPLWRWPQLVVATRGGRATAAALYAWPVDADAPAPIARVVRDPAGRWSAR